MSISRTQILLLTTALAIIAPMVHADERVQQPPSPPVAAQAGHWIFDARLRNEHVDQDGLAHIGNANTLRTRLGFETATINGFSGLIEVENISALGDINFNDTINAKATYPIIADPNSTTLNRIQLSYKPSKSTQFILGRQLINLDNQRFIGAVGWRQNDQTFDALSVKTDIDADTTFFAAYSHQVNRINGSRSPQGVWDDSRIYLLNFSHKINPQARLIAYGYWLDIPDAKALSSATLGMRFEGKAILAKGVSGLLTLDLARQSDYGANPNHFDFDYAYIEPGLSFGQWTFKALYESIQGNGTSAMQFALGTNHAFDGWADKFLTTPANGLVDKALSLTYVIKTQNPHLNGVKLMFIQHSFEAQRGGLAYGEESNGLVEQTINKHYTVGIKYADYQAKGLFRDTTKIMTYIQVKY